MKKFTKVLAVFCAMAMVVSVFSATVLADDEKSEELASETVAEAPAVEPAAEGEPAPEQESEQEPEPEPDPDTVLFANGVITQADINTNDGKMPETAGTYTLSENITVSKGAKIETQDASVTINLNGYTITYTGTESMYVVGKVRGTDGDDHNSNNNTAPIDYDNTFAGVTLTINGAGTITGEGTTGNGSKDYWINGSGVGTDNGRGGCVLVEWGSTFILDGATITGFEAKDEGGAICVSNGATFVMNSGAITNCSAGKGGGAISGHASSAATGPQGINIKASVTINGGTISGNEAGQLGGGVRINRSHFYFNGGEITNNNVKSVDGQNGGGGIEILHNKNGHEVMIQGSPKVYGNKVNGSVDVERANIFLDDCTITLSGDLSNSSKLGFSTKGLNANCFNINGKSYSLDSFVSDRAGYISYVSGSYIKVKAYTDPKVNGYIIGIGGEILFKVYVDFGTAGQSGVSINYTYSYTKSGSSEVVINKSVDSYSADNTGTYFVIPVESACMTAPITITLSYEGHDKVYTTTVEDVAKDSITIDPSYEDLVNALLTYGGYAQVQLKINADNLPTVSGVNFTVAPDFGLTSSTYTPASDLDRAFSGATVSFLSKTEIKLRFSKSALGDTAPTMTVNYAEGSKTVEAVEAGNYYIYTLKGYDGAGFKASKYNVSFGYSVGNVSGEYSVYTYLQAISGSGTQPMKNLAQAYYNFAVEATKFA